MLHQASNFEQNLNIWLKWVRKVYHISWCGGAVCKQGLTFTPTKSPSPSLALSDVPSSVPSTIPSTTAHICSGKNKTLCKKAKRSCVFGKKHYLVHVSQRNIINTIAPNTEIKGHVLLVKTMEDFATSTTVCVLICALITRKNTL